MNLKSHCCITHKNHHKRPQLTETMSSTAAAAYLSTPKPSNTYLMDISSSCPPPPRRSADESYSFVDNMCPTFPSLNTRNNGFFLAAPSSPYLMDDDEDEAFLSYQIPMLKPRASSEARSRVPISTLKPRPYKAAAGKMSPSLKNSYQLVLTKDKSGMHRSPSFHSPAA